VARVVLNTEFSRLADGATEVRLDADDFRDLEAALAARFPALGERLRAGVSVAIDGEMVGEPHLEPLWPDSEVVLLPRISGG
jgi:molybdopterin converting factor small subunit